MLNDILLSALHKEFIAGNFSPIMKLAPPLRVLDLTGGPIEISDEDYQKFGQNRVFAVGRYNEDRKDIYLGAQYQNPDGMSRTVHVGVDLVAAAGSQVFSFAAGTVFGAVVRPEAFDYGGTLIVEHVVRGIKFWALYGHLSHASIGRWKTGAKVEAGERIAALGDSAENGGWPPHLHFQVSTLMPNGIDMPGAVSKNDLNQALEIYLDPRIVLGELY
jgi:peptidoglycan LD-endopeptidase LytH